MGVRTYGDGGMPPNLGMNERGGADEQDLWNGLKTKAEGAQRESGLTRGIVIFRT